MHDQRRPTALTRALLTALALGSLLILPPRAGAKPAGAAGDLLILRTGQDGAAALAAQEGAQGSARALPLGLLDSVRHTLYAASSGGPGRTLLRSIDVTSGRVLRSLTVRGVFTTRTGDYQVGAYPLLTQTGPIGPYSLGAAANRAVTGAQAGRGILGAASSKVIASAAPASLAPALKQEGITRSPARAGYPADGSQVLNTLSFNGRWLALREVNSTATTRVLVIDTARFRVAADLTLDGAFGLDTISAGGALLYLIQPVPNSVSGAYQVRSYQVARKHLDARIVLSPGEVPGDMLGVAWDRVWSPDGAWLYTLYVGSSSVFVHALHLAARETRCIDFPISAQPADLAHFTLSVSPDGHTLYAVNSVLGKLVVVHNLPGGKVTVANLHQEIDAPQRTQDAAAISRDGKTVYVATSSGIWVIDTRARRLATRLLFGREITGVALSPDGQRLYAIAPATLLLHIVDTASNTPAGSRPLDQATWAIEQVLALNGTAMAGG